MSEMPRRRFYAHTRPDQGPEAWELLEDHLQAVAERCAGFAEVFGAAPLGRLAGLWHDLGKACPEFQQGVLGAHGDEAEADQADEENAAAAASMGRQRVDHSTAGARFAIKALNQHALGYALAYLIAGHHGQLPDWSGDGSNSSLDHRLNHKAIPLIAPPPMAQAPIDFQSLFPKDFTPNPTKHLQPFQIAFLTRMLFSALVDADRLATEQFCTPERAHARPTATSLAVLLKHLNGYLAQLQADRQGDPAPVDRHRAAVLAACRNRAVDPKGFFSLTVPTGGGKTLASMAFALEHAVHHNLRRVICALPFTSIIEQTAAIFREKVFAELPPGTVLEHHSNLDPESPSRKNLTAQLAAENFDAPLVVTTNVQLFESLFSAHGSTCRKLHRFAGSVILLDEAQTLSPALLRPTLAALDELVRNYHCTIVLCTATQPAIHHRSDFDIGLQNVHEIVPEPKTLYEAMRRVRVRDLGPLEDDQVIARLREQSQVLCIVNTRKHAAELVAGLEDQEHVLHLSAALCPEHRSDRVHTIKTALQAGKPCQVISTQVIEAGVDVDFPVVYRSLAGFDSIAQAAGRCNREGRQSEGEVFLFQTHHQPARSMKLQVDAAAELLSQYPDPLALKAIEAYFSHVYWQWKNKSATAWDEKSVMTCFESATVHRFREAQRNFRWIDTPSIPVLVPYGDDGRKLIEHVLTADEPDWQLLRRAQRFSVSVYDRQLEQLKEQTLIAPCFQDREGRARFWALTNPAAYDPQFGLRMNVSGWDAEALCV